MVCALHQGHRDGSILCVEHAAIFDKKREKEQEEELRNIEAEWVKKLPLAEMLYWAGLPDDPLERFVELSEQPSSGIPPMNCEWKHSTDPIVRTGGGLPVWRDYARLADERARALAALGGPLGAGAAFFERLAPFSRIREDLLSLWRPWEGHVRYIMIHDRVGLCSDGSGVHPFGARGRYEIVRSNTETFGVSVMWDNEYCYTVRWSHRHVLAAAVDAYNRTIPRRPGRDAWKEAFPHPNR